ncbi:protein mono-ADP-ribosyltransferase PARP14-like isoform X1 [Sphaeramia orbicularis]|uniref:protein mono-ADP-ribosyltransferase PARP14-like isoform X1 n=1 Tax=Sphaeramia orbicularis TaxID=375764 RepID=UPI00117EDA50|nr:protein mono-ADP-ribosyltransferase PARP14-like isoform X1 [Sphaeramia orbicularis]
MTSDLLCMLVETMTSVDETGYSLEVIWETNRAVVAFRGPTDGEKFMSVSKSSDKLWKRGMSARPLEAATSVRVETIPEAVVKDLLELYFEKSWTSPTSITMIPEEQAAVVAFADPEVVDSICVKQDHLMGSIAVKVYPYYDSLGCALYGKQRSAFKMPESVTENVHHGVWKFLHKKNLSDSINSQMRPFFCVVDLTSPEAKLSPLPTFLRQKDLDVQTVEAWSSSVLNAFRRTMGHYCAFDCRASAPAWKLAEKDVCSVVNDEAELVLDASRGVLTIAGPVDTIKRIRAPVENLVLKAMNHIDRQTNATSEIMNLAPAMFYILNQDGVQKAAVGISPDMKLSYNEANHKLTITGLPAEVYQMKAWILEKNVAMKRKPVNIPPSLLEFLKTVDPMEMSQDIFTSQGIGAIYSVDQKGLSLLGISNSTLTQAEKKMKSVLCVQNVDVQDRGVLKLHTWKDLNQKLLDSYNSLKKKTILIHTLPERPNQIMVAGFLNPVKETTRSLKEFIHNFSQIQEAVQVESCAVVQFIKKKKSNNCSGIAKDHDVSLQFDSERPRIVIAGARLCVHKAKSCVTDLTRALSTDTLMVHKPGAKKYFMSQGSVFLSAVMMEHNCAVVLHPELQDVDEEDGGNGDGDTLCYCRVQTTGGVQVSVSKADICHLAVDAVVNAANEELQHIGGVALALLNAAGPELQRASNRYVSEHGNLRPGGAMVMPSYNLPCKHVVHAVGPRFDSSDQSTSVRLLKQAVTESLKQAESVGCGSIALPAISAGVFGFPVELCANTIAQAVREFCDGPAGSLTEIQLVDNNDGTARVLSAAVSRKFSDLWPTIMVPLLRGGPRAESPRPQRGRGRGTHQTQTWSGEVGRRRGGGFQGPNRAQSPRGGGSRPGRGQGAGRREQMTNEGLKIVLLTGDIQNQTTDVVVNTISETLNLNQGAVSKALLQAAGPHLQSAVRSEADASTLSYGDVVVTDAFDLRCRKVFHTICPPWDHGGGRAQQVLASVVSFCLEEAEQLHMTSLSFPALGTGNLDFPRDLVSRVLLGQIQDFSRRRRPVHLQEVYVVVHPSDGRSLDCFSREFNGHGGEFKGHGGQRSVRPEADTPSRAAGQSEPSSASFSQVSSPSLGVYRMQMGHLTLKVSSGDITKEASDVIVNSSNADFTLKSGVSKAILECAGPSVESECSQIVNSQGFQSRPLILTSAGHLPSRNIVHIVGQNDPSRIKELVYAVLKVCEENRFRTVCFPALGTGQGGAKPSVVADAMVEAVVEFVRKKQPRSVQNVKILIFQKNMMSEFHRSMKKREGQEVQEKGLLSRFKDTVASVTSLIFGHDEERPITGELVLEGEEFEPTVFQLCADDAKTISVVKQKIQDLIMEEQAQRTIRDSFIDQLTQEDLDQLKELQRKLTVRIRLDPGQEDQEPTITVEGLTRDVLTAESVVRDVIRKVERMENQHRNAFLLSGLVEWQVCDSNGDLVSLDMMTNLTLEEALGKKTTSIKITINNQTFNANVMTKTAMATNGRRQVELLRKDLKGDSAALPLHWEDMKGDRVKLVPLKPTSTEHQEVEKELSRTGLNVNIISVERVQNRTLWQSYQLKKQQLDSKNQHTNNEKLLFHGTGADSIEQINEHGFNRSYAGTHAAMFGKGSYFAIDPAYSARGYAPPDAKGHKRMYLARVLVGDYAQGRGGMITPPAKTTGSSAHLYDSVTDNMSNPSMFVIFNDIQAYPQHLITFH